MGSVVLVNDHVNADDNVAVRPLMVARIVDVAHSNDGILPDQVENCKDSSVKVKVNLLTPFDAEMYRSSKAKLSLDDVRHVPELCQTTDFIWIAPNKIQDIAFVFLLSRDGKLREPIQGMARGFFVRFYYNRHTKTMEPIPDWSPFPCKSELDIEDSDMEEESDGDEYSDNPMAESYTRRMYNSCLALQTGSEKWPQC